MLVPTWAKCNRNQLSTQTIMALLCLGSWTQLGLVKDVDMRKIALMDDVEGEEEVELPVGWDTIDIE